MTSSEGFSFNDSKILIRPLVHELVKIANFLLNLFKSNLSSIFFAPE